jgi:hypothetical protein
MAALAARKVVEQLEKSAPGIKFKVHFVPTSRRDNFGKVRFYRFNDCMAFVYMCPTLDEFGLHPFEIKQYKNIFHIKVDSVPVSITIVNGTIQSSYGAREVTKSEYYNYVKTYKDLVKSIGVTHGIRSAKIQSR